jgi:hypothetical protein
VIEHEPVAERGPGAWRRVWKAIEECAPGGLVGTEHCVHVAAEDTPLLRRDLAQQRVCLPAARAIAEQAAQPPEAVLEMRRNHEQRLPTDLNRRGDSGARLPLAREINRAGVVERYGRENRVA